MTARARMENSGVANNQCSGYDGNGFNGDTENAAEDLWFVAAGAGVRSMSLDELDEAFALDLLDASTLVWRQGMDAWAPLAIVAGLSAESEEGSANDALALVDDEECTTKTDVFDRVLLASAGEQPRGRNSLLPLGEAPSGQSSVPVAMDIDDGARLRPTRIGTRWILGAAALAATCAFGINFVAQSLDRSRSVSVGSSPVEHEPMDPVRAVAARHPGEAERVVEEETNPTPNPALGEANHSRAQRSADLAAYVAVTEATSQEPLRSARQATASRVKTAMKVQPPKRAPRKRPSIARISAFAAAGSKAPPSVGGGGLDPLDAELPR